MVLLLPSLFADSDVMKLVRNAEDFKEAQLKRQLEMMRRGMGGTGCITYLPATGSFVDPHTVVAREADGKETKITADKFLIATGSSPRQDSKFKTDGVRIINSDHVGCAIDPRVQFSCWLSNSRVLDCCCMRSYLKDFPESMLVVGAGIIGAVLVIQRSAPDVHHCWQVASSRPFSLRSAAPRCTW